MYCANNDNFGDITWIYLPFLLFLLVSRLKTVNMESPRKTFKSPMRIYANCITLYKYSCSHTMNS